MKYRKFLFGLIFVMTLMASSVLLLEATLYLVNPLRIRLDPESFFLHQAKQDQSFSLIVRNKHISEVKMDKFILLKRNQLGLRGPDPTTNPQDFRIIAMGGSTTECEVLSDGTTWPDLVNRKLSENIKNIWVNNAGVNGQSTTGHISFLESSIVNLKPKVVLFLIGANEQNGYYLDETHKDFGRDSSASYDKEINREYQVQYKKKLWPQLISIVEKFKRHSKILLYISELRRRYLADRYRLGYQTVNFESFMKDDELITLSHDSQEREIDLKALKTRRPDLKIVKKELEAQKAVMDSVRENILKLISISRQHGITPVFITQPALFGGEIDPTTGVNLDKMVLQSGNVGWGQGLTGKEMWMMLEAYNDLTREVGREKNIKVIDLARKMPKDSIYYYDFVHYSKPGAQLVSQLIYDELCPYLVNAFDSLSQAKCSKVKR